MALTCKKILVLTDFSEAADEAVTYGTSLAKAMAAELSLIHIAPELPGGMMENHMIRSLMSQLQEQAQNNESKSGVTTSFVMKEGNIFEQIVPVCEETQADLIVMATHGKKGVQHLVGSFAGKMIDSSPIPLITIRKGNAQSAFQKITIPMDFSLKVGKLLEWISLFKNTGGLDLHLIIPGDTDMFPARKVDFSQVEVEAFLKEKKINFEWIPVYKAGAQFYNELLKHAGDNKSDLILMPLHAVDGSTGFSASAQTVITNEHHIPVMCLHTT